MTVEAIYPKDAQKLAEKLLGTSSALEEWGDSGLNDACELMDSAAGYIRWLEDRHYGEKVVESVRCVMLVPGAECILDHGWEIWETYGGQDGFWILLAKHVDRREGEP